MAEKHSDDDALGYLALVLTDPIMWTLVVSGIFGCVAARAALPFIALIFIVIGGLVWWWRAENRETEPSE
jgi:hypothetical protein